VHIEVSDNGSGISSGGMEKGIGIDNTRERLHASFGSNARFSLEPRCDGGTIAVIDILNAHSASTTS
jgi:Signal transduction histidine kinase, glucose-6-phosphate specific